MARQAISADAHVLDRAQKEQLLHSRRILRESDQRELQPYIKNYSFYSIRWRPRFSHPEEINFPQRAGQIQDRAREFCVQFRIQKNHPQQCGRKMMQRGRCCCGTLESVSNKENLPDGRSKWADGIHAISTSVDTGKRSKMDLRRNRIPWRIWFQDSDFIGRLHAFCDRVAYTACVSHCYRRGERLATSNCHGTEKEDVFLRYKNLMKHAYIVYSLFKILHFKDCHRGNVAAIRGKFWHPSPYAGETICSPSHGLERHCNLIGRISA